MRRWLLVGLGWIACGDNTHRDDALEAVSGSRIVVQWYGYADGTRQAEANEYYDTQVHTRCTPQRWVDAVIRCVPVADDAVYVDATCETVIGRGRTIAKPSHFLGYDRVAAQLVPARVYLAGNATTPVAQFYERWDGACVGPLFSPAEITYYEIVGEVSGSDLVTLGDDEVGDGRLGLRVRTTDDGLRVPFGLRDRDLDVDCTPALRSDGSVACEPAGSARTRYFHDPACREPVIVVADAAPVPAIAAVVEPSGCTSYHAVGGEVSVPIYTRDGDACLQIALLPAQRVFAVEATLGLPALGRTIEDVATRRLLRIMFSDGELRFAHDRLFDTATRTECRRHAFADVTRCIPASVATATTLFAAGCGLEVTVAEIPQRSCDRLAFATKATPDGFDIHSIGDRVAGTLFHFEDGRCQPYTPAAGATLHTLGPAIDPQAFTSAVYFGER